MSWEGWELMSWPGLSTGVEGAVGVHSREWVSERVWGCGTYEPRPGATSADGWGKEPRKAEGHTDPQRSRQVGHGRTGGA